MPLQAWIDDSGDKGQPGYLTLAGVIGEAEEWASFSTEWKRRLDAPPAISYLSTSDARGYRFPFNQLNRAQRDNKISFLTSIVNDFDLRLVACSVDLAAFKELHVPPPPGRTKRERALLTALTTHPYLLACNLIALVVWADIAVIQRKPQRFELILDEKKRLEWKVDAWWPVFRHTLTEEQRSVIPKRPRFEDDVEWMPLQLADFIAHTWRAEEMKELHPFVPAIKRMKFTQRQASWYRFDKPRLERFFGAVRGDPGHEDRDAELVELAMRILSGDEDQ
jgi:uncharacterized protein DUF3800